MPDGLLAGFTLFVGYLLIYGDHLLLQNKTIFTFWHYLLSGVLLGWCTLVNMSSVSMVMFISLYLFSSSLYLFYNHKKYQISHVNIIKRFTLLPTGFLIILLIPFFFHGISRGDPFAIFRDTLSTYQDRSWIFNTNPMYYPGMMFHVDLNWNFSFKGWSGSYYGFYFLFLPVAILYGLWSFRWHSLFCAFWFLCIFCFLQWGSMSLTNYLPIHRLYRHLSLVTPPLILCLSYTLADLLKNRLTRIISVFIITFLCISGFIFTYFHHLEMKESLEAQYKIRSYITKINPKLLFIDDRTIAFQRFLDKFQEKGVAYNSRETVKKFPKSITDNMNNVYYITGMFREARITLDDLLT